MAGTVTLPPGFVLDQPNVPEGFVLDLKAPGTLDYNKLIYAPTVGMNAGERAAAGAGKAVIDLFRGAKQIVGAESQPELAAIKAQDEPLMATTAGKVGNVLGNTGAASASILVPGANTVAGAALTGAVMGAFQPVETGNVLTGKLKNAAEGAVLSGGTQLGARGVANVATSRAASLDKSETANSVRDATLKAGKDLGYVAPPAQANPTWINRLVEGFAGKLTTAQSASGKNQPLTNAIAAEHIGLSPDTPITRDVIKSVRKQAGQDYAVIKGMGTIGTDQKFTTDLDAITQKFQGAEKDFPELAKTDIKQIVQSVNKAQFSADSGIDAISILRDRASVAYRKGDTDLGGAYRQASKALEDLIDRNISARGPEYADVLQKYRNAREMIAKTYSVENALNEATGNVSAVKLGGQLKAGKPLSGDLKTAATFANAFPKSMQENLTSMPGVSPLDYAVAGATSVAAGSPGPMAAVGARPLARSVILSKLYQNAMASPNYEPSFMTRMTPAVLGNPRVQALLRNLVPASAFTFQK